MTPLVKKELLRFLEEDIGRGDITSEAICRGEHVKALIKAKGKGVLAGSPFVKEIFKILGGVHVVFLKDEGEVFKKGEILAELEGDSHAILSTERTVLNLLQSLSGIATRAKLFAEALEGTNIKILDTRKTTPGFRFFEKYAVRVGGGTNHRFALYDMILIKDNHKKIAGSVKEAIRRVKETFGHIYKIEVEVENLWELQEALSEGVDVVMLDNFDPQQVKEAVKIVKGKVKVEVSGNITFENLKNYAIEGVDFISAGTVIYGASWIDLSLKVL